MATNGELLRSEIREQPDAMRRLLDTESELELAAKQFSNRAPRVVRFAAHGSSDAAASYGVYTFGLLAGLTGMRDSISLSVYYGAEIDFSDSAVIALSQSGATPDVVRYVELARDRGALTIAITNDVTSELAEAAESVISLAAGVERSIAATKTYLNELGALALLAATIGGRGEAMREELRCVAGLIESAIPDLESSALRLAPDFAPVSRMYVVGRGVELATARETALKLTEVCRVAAGPLTATDLAHGPIAAVDAEFPIWAIASDDEALPAITAAVDRARAVGAKLISVGSAAAALGETAYVLATPRANEAVLCPLLSVVPGQLFACALARAKGLDPDNPTHLSKITVVP